MSTTEVVTVPPKRKTKEPKRLGLASFTKHNIGTVRKLNSVLLPVSYSDKFYKDVLAPELEEYCKLAFFNDIPVGAIACKFEDKEHLDNSPTCRLYLATIGVLAPYRHQGLASLMLDNLFAQARESHHSMSSGQASVSTSKDKDKKGGAVDASSRKHRKIEAVYLHVQTSMTDARAFWESKGFTVIETIDQYYTKIEPTGAWVMEKRIDP